MLRRTATTSRLITDLSTLVCDRSWLCSMIYRQAHQPGRGIPCARHPGDPLKPVREHVPCPPQVECGAARDRPALPLRRRCVQRVAETRSPPGCRADLHGSQVVLRSLIRLVFSSERFRPVGIPNALGFALQRQHAEFLPPARGPLHVGVIANISIPSRRPENSIVSCFGK
jgi:hypothetical protein